MPCSSIVPLLSKFGEVLKTHKKCGNFHNKGGRTLKLPQSDPYSTLLCHIVPWAMLDQCLQALASQPPWAGGCHQWLNPFLNVWHMCFTLTTHRAPPEAPQRTTLIQTRGQETTIQNWGYVWVPRALGSKSHFNLPKVTVIPFPTLAKLSIMTWKLNTREDPFSTNHLILRDQGFTIQCAKWY